MLTVDPAKRATVDDICCDLWVDIGEDVPLIEIAQEMCKQMPVRLDYLLALTAGALPPPSPEEANDAVLQRLETVPSEEIGVPRPEEVGLERGDEEDDESQWERPALQALESDADGRPEINGDASKKHKLASSSSVVGNRSTDRAVFKKKKGEDGKPPDDEKPPDDDEKPPDDDDDRGENVVTPVISEVHMSKDDSPEDKSKDDTSEDKLIEPMEAEISKDSSGGRLDVAVTHEEATIDTKENDASVATDTLEPPTSNDVPTSSTNDVVTPPSTDEPKPSTDKPQMKRRTLSIKRQSSIPASSGTSAKSKMNGADGGANDKNASGSVSAPVSSSSRVPKLRKSISKDNGSPVTEKPQTPPGQGTERRKLVFSSFRVSDAKKSFEAKTSDRKPGVIPGLKSSPTKKTAESPPVAQEGGAVTPSSSLLTTKNSGKSFVPKSTTTSSSTGDNVAQEPTETASIPTESSDSRKNIPLSRQPSKGNTRTSSPTKAIRGTESKLTEPSALQQHHRGCLPHDAKTAGASRDAKKSPPKALLPKRKSPPAATSTDTSITARKNSLTKTNGVVSRATTVSKDRDVNSMSRRLGSIGIPGLSRPSDQRTRSPTKVVKGKDGDAEVESPVVPPPARGLDICQTDVEDARERGVHPEEQETDENHVESAIQEKLEQDSVSSTTVTPSSLESVLKDSLAEGDKKHEKRGSIEIAPLPSSAVVRRYSSRSDDGDDEPEIGAPLVRFVPRDKSGFTLLGVKSEVLFDVAGDVNRARELEEADLSSANQKTAAEETNDETDDRKIIRYIATVRRHGSSDEQLDEGPERVTLLDLRCTASGDVTSNTVQVPSNPKKTTVKAEISTEEDGAKEKEPTKSTASERSEERIVESESHVDDTEHRGYSVYRSKFRSVRKYSSVVERRGEGETTFEGYGVRPPSVERCDSFSSNGSTDDMEDVFESLTSESLFTSLLSRTRNMMGRLTEGDAHATRWLQSCLTARGRTSPMSIGIGATISPFALGAPSISIRASSVAGSRRNYADSSVRYTGTSRRRPLGDYDSEAAAYTSDSCCGSSAAAGRQTPRRWLSSRSSVHCCEDHNDDDMGHYSDVGTGSSSKTRLSRSPYVGYDGRHPVSPTSSLRSEDTSSSARRQSRYEAFRSSDATSMAASSVRDRARTDVLSALLRHRNGSLDSRRPGSNPYEVDHLERDWSSCKPSSSSSTLPPSTTRAQRSYQRLIPDDVMVSGSPYATTRRPARWQRYSKSVTKELSEEFDSEADNLHRPHSVLVLSEANGDNDKGTPTGAAGSSVSVSRDRDYSRTVSHTGGVRQEKEEEVESEHHVTKETKGGRTTTTTRRECMRSISQTHDSCEGNNCASNAPSVRVPQRQSITKQGSGDGEFPSRQDSGVGSMQESSAPSTPTSVCSQVKRSGSRGSGEGYSRFARTVSDELQSLEEEVNRIGVGTQEHQAASGTPRGTRRSPPDCEGEGGGGGNCGGGRRLSQASGEDGGPHTPTSDSSEPPSTCSDTPGSQQQNKGPAEEESVGERIRRKSYFQRFNESRIPRNKGRKSSTGTSGSSMRSELGRSSSLRHQYFYEDDFPWSIGGPSSRPTFDAGSELYIPPSIGRHGSGAGSSGQRWSMHFGNGAPGNLGDADLQYGVGEPPMPSTPSRRRRSSLQNAAGSVAADNVEFPHRPSDDGVDDDRGGEWNASMGRTHSLPEESSPPPSRPVFRQHSMPSANAESDGGQSSESLRRPSRLGLRLRKPPGEEEKESSATSPSEPLTRSWRRGTLTTPHGSRSRMYEPIDNWEGGHFRSGIGGSTFSSLMDSLGSPSEVLQKAMDLCDSLRFS